MTLKLNKVKTLFLIAAAFVPFCIPASLYANTSLEKEVTPGCLANTRNPQLVPNHLTSNASEGIYGYSSLYYLPLLERDNNAIKMLLVSNSKEITTQQSILDDTESMISVEKYTLCPEKDIVVVRARYFESGLEYIIELGYIYTLDTVGDLQFLGQYEFVIGQEEEYVMLMNDEILLPSDLKDTFSKLEFKVSDCTLTLDITNFLETRNKEVKFPLKDSI